MMPAPGFYRLTLPPFPWPMIVEVVPLPFASMKSALGTWPYALTEDVFSVGPTSYVKCLGDGQYEVVINGVSSTGTCSPA